jgi:hypothetical protein
MENSKISSNLCYNMQRMSKYKVIIPVDLKPSPAQYELSAAALIAHYFKADVEFIPHQIKSAAKQSCNIILDVRNSKMHMTKIRSEVRRHFKFTKAIKRLVLIDKAKHVVELSK